MVRPPGGVDGLGDVLGDPLGDVDGLGDFVGLGPGLGDFVGLGPGLGDFVGLGEVEGDLLGDGEGATPVHGARLTRQLSGRPGPSTKTSNQVEKPGLIVSFLCLLVKL